MGRVSRTGERAARADGVGARRGWMRMGALEGADGRWSAGDGPPVEPVEDVPNSACPLTRPLRLPLCCPAVRVSSSSGTPCCPARGACVSAAMSLVFDEYGRPFIIIRDQVRARPALFPRPSCAQGPSLMGRRGVDGAAGEEVAADGDQRDQVAHPRGQDGRQHHQDLARAAWHGQDPRLAGRRRHRDQRRWYVDRLGRAVVAGAGSAFRLAGTQ